MPWPRSGSGASLPNLWRRTDFSQLSIPIDIGVQVYKSGIPREYLADMGHRIFAMPNVELVGLHFHVGRHHPSLWFWKGLMTRYARLVGELSRAWGGWRPAELDVGGGMPSPRDPHNQELARSEFLLTSAGYPLMVGARRLGEDAYYALMGRLVPALEGHRERNHLDTACRPARGGSRDPGDQAADRARTIDVRRHRDPPHPGQEGEAAARADPLQLGARRLHLLLPRGRGVRAQPAPVRCGSSTLPRP